MSREYPLNMQYPQSLKSQFVSQNQYPSISSSDNSNYPASASLKVLIPVCVFLAIFITGAIIYLTNKLVDYLHQKRNRGNNNQDNDLEAYFRRGNINGQSEAILYDAADIESPARYPIDIVNEQPPSYSEVVSIKSFVSKLSEDRSVNTPSRFYYNNHQNVASTPSCSGGGCSSGVDSTTTPSISVSADSAISENDDDYYMVPDKNQNYNFGPKNGRPEYDQVPTVDQIVCTQITCVTETGTGSRAPLLPTSTPKPSFRPKTVSNEPFELNSVPEGQSTLKRSQNQNQITPLRPKKMPKSYTTNNFRSNNVASSKNLCHKNCVLAPTKMIENRLRNISNSVRSYSFRFSRRKSIATQVRESQEMVAKKSGRVPTVHVLEHQKIYRSSNSPIIPNQHQNYHTPQPPKNPAPAITPQRKIKTTAPKVPNREFISKNSNNKQLWIIPRNKSDDRRTPIIEKIGVSSPESGLESSNSSSEREQNDKLYRFSRILEFGDAVYV